MAKINAWGSDDPAEETKGGTGTATYTTGDILYSDASNSLAKLGIGSTDEVLTVSSGIPSWAAASGGSGAAQAWVYFNGTGTVAINDSFGVDSITDNNTGDYTINITSGVFSTTDYSYNLSSGSQYWNAGNNSTSLSGRNDSYTKTTAAFKFETASGNWTSTAMTLRDEDEICATFYGGQ